MIIPEPNIVIGRVIKGVIVGVDNAPGGRVVPPDSPDHHGLTGGRLQHGQLVLLAQGLEAGQPLGELDDELDRGEGGLGHLDQGLVLDIRLVVDEAVNLIQQGHAGLLQLGPCFWTIRIRAGTNERMICSRKSGRRENILAINSFELVSQPQ